MTEDQVFATLERERPKWRALAYKCGAKDFEIDQVIQDAGLSETLNMAK